MRLCTAIAFLFVVQLGLGLIDRPSVAMTKLGKPTITMEL